ncbi:hypothetical protein J2R98_000157 [Alkalibacillus filiformis]|uniref:Uncharacterized protein n=1 Tax=Alkalibacillus filiformis TaxID=200990 RepID=A0ABU0DPI9_9BACI|nr:hypothetical protein [Alkalibacillus filiformis]MDQ0350354.1 hypothetical protein [Alkalibacillus filiformis]
MFSKLMQIVKWSIIILVIMSVGYGGTFFFEKASFLTISYKEKDELIKTIWTIQATVVTFGIALLALIVGSNREKRYGINVLEFYFVKIRPIFNRYEVIILLISLVFLNYFFVAFNYLFGTLFIFFISICCVIDILFKILTLVRMDEKGLRNIENFILQRCVEYIQKEENK